MCKIPGQRTAWTLDEEMRLFCEVVRHVHVHKDNFSRKRPLSPKVCDFHTFASLNVAACDGEGSDSPTQAKLTQCALTQTKTQTCQRSRQARGRVLHRERMTSMPRVGLGNYIVPICCHCPMPKMPMRSLPQTCKRITNLQS